MSNILNVKEDANVLSFVGEPMNIVAKSTNFYLKFNLSDDWANSPLVSVIFDFEGRREYVDLDDNFICQIPPTESPKILFCLTAEPNSQSKISSTILSLDVVDTGDTNLEGVEEYQEAHGKLIGIIDEIQKAYTEGVKLAKHAITADEAIHAISADSAITATTATKALSAEEATHAESADNATDSEHATNAEMATYAKGSDNAKQAEHAVRADSATNASMATKALSAEKATHAESADKATNAEYADNATYATSAGSAIASTSAKSAETADYATVAGISQTQVSLTGDESIDGIKTFNAPPNTSGAEQATTKFKTSNGGSIIIGKEGKNSGTMLRFDQVDGTPRLKFRSSATAGYMVWEQPEKGANLAIDLGKEGEDYRRILMPSKGGTLVINSDLTNVSNKLTTLDERAVKTSGDQTINGKKTFVDDLTIGGNLNVTGTTTTVDSTTLQVKDKLIEVAHGNMTSLTTPAGIVASKYNGEQDGALVFDNTGTAYVGDVSINSNGDIDVENSDLQALATREDLTSGNLPQWDETKKTFVDSGTSVSEINTNLNSKQPKLDEDQLSAVNSGISADRVSIYEGYASAISARYKKPFSGIPKADLDSEVRDSLGKADTALQEHQDISGKINSSGDTFTGAVNFKEKDGECINFGTQFYINGNNGSSTLLGADGQKTYLGMPAREMYLRGNKTRPYYNGSDLALKSDIPTKVSELSNDNGYITSEGVPTYLSELTNDSGYITSSGVPTKTSQLANDSGYITSEGVPTKLSELTNDSGYTTNTGTITGIKMNGEAKGTVGVVDLGTVITDVSDKANISDVTALTTRVNTAETNISKANEKIGGLGNPNLLYNSRFFVNQRASSKYTRSGTDIYTADRWILMNGNGTFAPNTKKLVGTDETASTILCQWVEDSKDLLLGNKISISAVINDVYYSGSATLADTVTEDYYLDLVEKDEFILRLYVRKTGKLVGVQFVVENGVTITIDKVKLEISDFATMYSDRPITEDTVLCQRYYQKIRAYAVGYAKSETQILFFVPTSTPYRNTKTITVSTAPKVIKDGELVTVDSFAISDAVSNGIILTATGSGFATNSAYFLANGFIKIDGEFY